MLMERGDPAAEQTRATWGCSWGRNMPTALPDINRRCHPLRLLAFGGPGSLLRLQAHFDKNRLDNWASDDSELALQAAIMRESKGCREVQRYAMYGLEHAFEKQARHCNVARQTPDATDVDTSPSGGDIISGMVAGCAHPTSTFHPAPCR